MKKRLACYKSPSHQLFYRKIVVEGVAVETRDEMDHPLDVHDPTELTLVKRITGVYCLVCDQQANVRMPF
jgi:hypothetical protein